MMRRVALIVVFYNPEPADIAFWKGFHVKDTLLLAHVNMSPDCRWIGFDDESVWHVEFTENIGLSSAYNQSIKYCWYQGIEYAFIFDQDSRVTSQAFSYAVSYILNLDSSGSLDKIGLFHCITGHELDSIWLGKQSLPISSGSIVCTHAWKRIGGFDERLFIDRVDWDFAMRLVANGYHIKPIDGWSIDHDIGNVIDARLGLLYLGRYGSHTSIRHYYISRNRVYCLLVKARRQEYGSISILQILFFLFIGLVRHFVEILMFETNKTECFKGFFVGIKDGIHLGEMVQ